MQVYELHHRPGFDAIMIADRERAPLGPRDVRVRVRAASLNYRDLLMARRAGAGELSRPIVPLSDGAGDVIAVGADVTRFAVGSRVVACFFPTWLDQQLSAAHHAAALGGGTVDGMLAEEVVLDENALLAVPEHLSFVEAATLPCAALTAWHALFEIAAVRPGDTVVVQGTGGVSLFALQLARAAGARVILTSSSAEKRARATALGAAATIDYVALPDWARAVREHTGGRGADLVVEVGGPATLDQSVAAVRYGGTVALIGVLTGFVGPIDTYAILHKTVRVAGVYVGSRRMFESMNAALSANALHPIVDRVFPFAEARQAYEHLATGAHFGKVVVELP